MNVTVSVDSPARRAELAGMLLTRQGWFLRGLAFLLLGVAALFGVALGDTADWWLHGLWCVVGLMIAVSILAKVFRSGFITVLRDHRVMFTAAFTLYFLFGASLLSFGTEDSIGEATRNYSVDAVNALKVDAVNAIGFGLALMASALSAGRWIGKQADRFGQMAAQVSPALAISILMAVGALASANVLLFDFAIKSENVAGIWRAASQFDLVVILLGSAYRGRRESTLRMAAILITIVESTTGILLFNKSAMLLPIAALIGGLAARYGVRKVLPAGFALLVLIFAAVGGAVGFGRMALNIHAPHSLETRWQTFQDGIAASRAGDVSADYSAWGRLCYMGPQSAAHDFYDGGIGGDEFRLIPWLFVPRAIAPEKPIITQVGVDFNKKLTGSEGSATGMGIFSSGYYNAGWLGLVLASLICGWLLSQTSSVAAAILRRNALLLLPFALLGVNIAFRIDGHFVSDFLGSFVFLLYPVAVGSLFSTVRGSRN